VGRKEARYDHVLMAAFKNEEAWQETLETGRVTLHRGMLRRVWVKGEDD
jgi:phosphoribosyl-AMP cyclohydrolase